VSLTIDGDSGEISVSGDVEETRFHFLKLRLRCTIHARVGEPGFRLQDEIQNLSQSPAEAQLLYHINFGRPLLDAGARLIAPVRTVVPRDKRAAEGIQTWDSFAAEQPGYAEQVYFLELVGNPQNQTKVLLKNAHATRGVTLAFDRTQLPWFTLWKNTTATPDGYVTGLEPATNFPNPRSFEGKQGRTVKLPPLGTARYDLQLTAHASAAEVDAAHRAIESLQQGTVPQVHSLPQPGWCLV
jgi:hypothetical protein